MIIRLLLAAATAASSQSPALSAFANGEPGSVGGPAVMSLRERGERRGGDFPRQRDPGMGGGRRGGDFPRQRGGGFGGGEHRQREPMRRQPEYRREPMQRQPEYRREPMRRMPEHRREPVQRQPEYRREPIQPMPEHRRQPVQRMPERRREPEHRRPPVIVDPGSRGPNRRLPRPPRIDRGLDWRRDGDDSGLNFPRPSGERPHADRWGRRIAPGRSHVGAITDPVIVGRIRHHERDWRRGRYDYEWHDWNGRRLCHYRDRVGRHWWGFYFGSTYFWARYHNDYFWWYDPYFRRWIYLHEGRWWYRDPINVTVYYIYDEGRYYRYRDARGGIALIADHSAPYVAPPAAPAPEPEETYVSEDGSRQVLIAGANRDAFLYDTAEPPAFEPQYLASNVKEVQFSTGAGTLQIMLVTETQAAGGVQRGFQLFDADGISLTAPANAAEAPVESLREGSPAFQQLESAQPVN